MRDELARERAVNELRYGGGALAGIAQARRYEPTAEEAQAAEEHHRAYVRLENRRQALAHTLALGRRYERAEDAIDDARTIATFLGLEI